jgi:hypothetical protein
LETGWLLGDVDVEGGPSECRCGSQCEKACKHSFTPS